MERPPSKRDGSHLRLKESQLPLLLKTPSSLPYLQSPRPKTVRHEGTPTQQRLLRACDKDAEKQVLGFERNKRLSSQVGPNVSL